MFCYEKPLFEKKRLLRVEMLEQLRDYPRDYLEIRYAAFCDGVLYGCEPVWDGKGLMVSPGILRHKGRLYFMSHAEHLACRPEDRVRYLKVQFLALVQEKGQVIGNTRICLDAKAPDPACELELCRFRLQEGARLRDTYENFADCTTEFDTIHLIEVPWAACGEATLHPKILKQFAMDIRNRKNMDDTDIHFVINVLANEGVMQADAIRMYLETRLGTKVGKGNRELYLGLKKILETGGSGYLEQQRSEGNRRQVMLL